MAEKIGAGNEPQNYNPSNGRYVNGDGWTKEKRDRLLGVLRKRKASGAISGALNSDSDEAKEHAKKYYEFLKNTKSDVSKISHNTGIKEETIQKIKNYLFIDSHDLSDGYHPFYPDYDIAVSW